MLEIGLAELCEEAYLPQEKPQKQVNKIVKVPSVTSYEEQKTEALEHEIPAKETEKIIKPEEKGVGGGIADCWGEVINELKQEGKMMLGLSVVLARPVDKGDKVEIVFKPQNAGNKNMIDNPENEKAVSDAFYRVTGRNVRVKFVTEGQPGDDKVSQTGNVMDLAKQFPDIVSIDESEE
jgi:hypothetical protein